MLFREGEKAEEEGPVLQKGPLFLPFLLQKSTDDLLLGFLFGKT